MQPVLGDVRSAKDSDAPWLFGQAIRLIVPAARVLGQIAMFLLPWIVMLCKAIYNVYCLVPLNLLYAGVGLIFCFFGGTYPVLFAALEAARLSGWETTKFALKDIADQALEMVKHSAADDLLDEDDDGIADVKQIDSKALFQRKTNLVLRKCDPVKLNAAVGGLWMAWIGVVATLKVKFAATITLALTIADVVGKPIDMIAMGPLVAVVPTDYAKWIPVTLGWVCKAIGMSVAWYLQAIMSACTSGVRGGLMFSRSMVAFMSNAGITCGGLIPMHDEKKQRAKFAEWVAKGKGKALVSEAKKIGVSEEKLSAAKTDEHRIDLLVERTQERLQEDTYIDEVVGWLMAGE